MSRWWPDTLHAGLAPGRVEVLARGPIGTLRYQGTRTPGNDEPPPVAGEVASASTAPPAWRIAVDALADEVSRMRLAPGSVVRLVLASAFVRYAVVELDRKACSQAEVNALLAHRFRGIYGGVADQWQISVDEKAFGTRRLACAMDRVMLDALRQMCRVNRLRLQAIQPNLALRYNQLRRQLRAERLIFALVEPESLTLATFISGQWSQVHTVRGSGGIADELGRALLRDAAMHGCTAQPTLAIHVDSSMREAVAEEIERWHLCSDPVGQVPAARWLMPDARASALAGRALLEGVA